MATDPSLPFSKISIPGPTLSSLLRHSSSSASAAGLLFGHVTSLPSPAATDDVDPTAASASAPSPCPLSLTVTSFISSPSPLPFFSSLGQVDPTSPLLSPNPSPSSSVVGWFSSRPRSQIRPSMRELAASHHLAETLTLAPSSKTCVFLLLSSSSTSNQAIHTHEYRAYLLTRPSILRSVSVDVINVGPKFRGQYGAFMLESSVAGFPLMPCRVRVSEEGEGYMETESSNVSENVVDWSVEGFGVERLEGLMGEKAAEYTRELEDLYGKMMGKLEGLVRLVEASSVKVHEQESRISVLQRKIAGLD